MFNTSKKIENLNERLRVLESMFGSSTDVFPGEDYNAIEFLDVPRISIMKAMRLLFSHLDLEFKRTPATCELKKIEPAPNK